MSQETAKCKECEKEVSVWEMELEPIWTCYDCLDKRELTMKETGVMLINASDLLKKMNAMMSELEPDYKCYECLDKEKENE